MNRATRLLKRMGAGVALGAMVLPIALLIPSALLDRGPSGGVRASLFPAALTLWDPYAWACVRNSALLATVVTAGSLMIGSTLARAVGPRRFWGRGPLCALAWASLAVAPGFGAIGLAGLVPPEGAGHRLALVSGWTLILGVPWDVWISWTLLAWANLATSVPLVALGIVSAIGRVDPAWLDAGRSLGASRRRSWRELAWPIVRPEAARSLAAVFAFSFLEPGGPLALGLRRTLPSALIEAALRGDDRARAATLGLLGLGFALLGRGLIRWWGGPRAGDDRRDSGPATRLDDRAGTLRGLASVTGLLAWSAIGLAPLGGLVALVFGVGAGGGWGASVVAMVASVREWLDPDIGRAWINSLMVGLAATGLDLAILGLLAPRSEGQARSKVRPSIAILALERLPAPVIGVAVLLAPWTLAASGEALGFAGGSGLPKLLDPIRWPGALLILAASASRLPTLARAADRARARSRPDLADAALVLGSSPGRAIRLAGGRRPGKGAILLTATLAATSVAPAVLLSPTSRTRPVGPVAIRLAPEPGRAAGLGLGASVLTLIALASTRRGRSGPLGEWYRG